MREGEEIETWGERQSKKRKECGGGVKHNADSGERNRSRAGAVEAPRGEKVYFRECRGVIL